MLDRTLQRIKSIAPAKGRSYIRQKMFALLGAPFFRFGYQSFSQAGEDCVLRFLFSDCGIPLHRVSYLDIGCRHPISGSNTFLLYNAGARGVCVDADVTFIEHFRETRPRDTVLNMGVSTKAGDAQSLYFMEGGGSTFNKKEADQRVAMGNARIAGVISVPVIDINTLLTAQFESCPLLLSIDIESLDLPVLQLLDFDAFPISIICAETCQYSDCHVREKDRSIAVFLESKGYMVYADTYINTIFVLRSWFYALATPARLPHEGQVP